LPAELTGILADSEAGVGKSGLFDDRRQLSALIRRATTLPTTSIPLALGAAKAPQSAVQ
jgi:hypothetical protein